MRGRVRAFDEHRGSGELEDDGGGVYPFHCTRIADGSRTRVTIRLTGFPSSEWGEMAKYGLAESFDRLGYAVAGMW